MLMYLLPGFIGSLIGTGYFSFFIYRLLTKVININISRGWLIGLIIIVFLLSLPAINIFYLYAIIYFHLLFISLFLEILNIFLKNLSFYNFPFITGILTIIITIIFITYGFYNMNNVQETNYNFISKKIDNLKIVQVTDLHMSNSVNVEKLNKYCDEMSKLKSDIVVLTGDIFDESTPLKDMQAACKLLGNISNTKGVYYVYGNHDCQNYSDNPVFNRKDIREEFEKNSVVVLEDETYTIDNITIVGRTDASFLNDKPRKTTKELLAGKDLNNYIIVLDHQPLDIKENQQAGADLQLSGHTHGGQIFPQQQIQPLFNGELTYGQRTIKSFHAITSSGISGWGYPIKTGAISEYVLITIK